MRSIHETLFALLGEEPGIKTLVDRFYDHMDRDPDAATIRAMHPDDLTGSRTHLTWFLVMWTGGPRTYLEERGHAGMRRRHLPFAIDAAATAAWMACMDRALEETVDDPALREALHDAFGRIGAHLQNS